MGAKFNEILDKHKAFIETQKIFFIGTADTDGFVNISPKGTDSLRILNSNKVAWMNLTGSGNESSAHVQKVPRMTIMFNEFEGNPMILRLYGKASVVHQNNEKWTELYALFTPNIGARQIFVLDIEMVQTSCGMAVPFFDYRGEREQLNDWATKKGKSGIKQYWAEKNHTTLNGKPTFIKEKNL
jgi:hypothetical protein